VKATQRHAAAAVGFFALSMTGATAFAQQAQPAQRGGPPVQDTPYILVTTFQSADRKLGVEAGDELRRRIQSEHSAKELYAVPKNQINGTLEASGYRPDSALNASDLMELSKQLHGEYVIDGKAIKGSGNAVRMETRILLRTGQSTLAQPLPPADGKDVGDAAKMVEKSITDALKGMKPYKDCINDLRANKFDVAEKDARLGISVYSNSVLSRICLLQAQANLKASPDSIMATANAILAVDPTSQLALVNLVDAYKAKGEKDKAIEVNLRIWRLDPTNQSIAQSIVADLAQSGAPDKALQIIDTLLKENPQDPPMIKQKWLLQLRAGQYKNAMATGEELMKLDTAAANLDFYNRQVAAAQSDSNVAKVQEWASKAAAKFPTDASFPTLLAQSYRKSGQLQQALAAARRATQIEPKNGNAWLFAVVTANDLQMPDTAVMLAQQAIAAGADKTSLGQALLAVVNPLVKKATDSKERTDWEAALKMAQTVDAAIPNEATKFYVGLTSFQVGLDALQNAQKLGGDKGKDAKESRAKACVEAKVAEDSWATSQIAIPRGAAFNKEGAGQIMGVIQQYSEFIPKMKTQYCTGK
jgi:tetratricopeptide (TPR) repeat protein